MNGIGVPLLPSEMDALGEAISSAADVVPVLQTYGEGHPDSYAGVLVDGSQAVLLMKGNPVAHRDALSKILPLNAPYEVRSAAWSALELESFASTVEAEADWFQSIGAEFVAADVGAAGVRIRYLAPNDRINPLIQSHFGDQSWMLIEWSGPLPWKGRRGTLVVKVVDESRKPVAGATCETTPVDPTVDADMGVAFITSDEGTCTIAGLPAVAYDVRIVDNRGNPVATARVVITDVATNRLNLIAAK